jgi:hypothetical protein
VRLTVLISLLAVFLTPAAPAHAATRSTRPNVRAMWLWNRPPVAQVITWATGHGVREILVYVPPKPDLGYLRELRVRASAVGVTLSALGGEPTWTTDHAAALAWQRAAAGTGLFSRIHLDVEPYTLPAWRTDRTATTRAYLALLDKLRAARTLPLEADVPFWYGQHTISGRNLATEVLARLDAITVLSYRDTATGPGSVLDVGADYLARGATAGKPVRLAVETQPLADCPYCTFAGKGAAALTAATGQIDATATAGYPSYAGLAIHHYASWQALGA